MKKSIVFSIIFISLFSLFFIVSPTKSRTKAYYSGDAAAYQDKLYVVSANSGSLELFRLEGNDLARVAKIRTYDPKYASYGDFYDAKLSVEDGRLFIYAVSNYTIYKYELFHDQLNLIKQNSNTYWEWYNRVDKFGDKLVTVSAKGVKVINRDLDTVVAYDFANLDAPYNISGNGRYLLNIDEANNRISVYDTESRNVIQNIALNFGYHKGNRRAYQDVNNNIYVVDDYYTKKFDLSGKLLASFKHLDQQGFDVSGNDNSEYVYFSNGVGVVKLDKNMKAVDWAWTGNLGAYAGWAMGLKSVYLSGDKLVVFNNSNILILDENLKKIASVEANEPDKDYPTENLFLNLDKASAASGSDVLLSGGGFLPNESLKIKFCSSATTTPAVADARGRFSSRLSVPSLNKGACDIRVDGQNSQMHYNISFRIE